MNQDQTQAVSSILSGINYLMSEAESNNIDKVARILKLCIRDICIAIESGPVWQEDRPSIINSDLFNSIQFLTQVASIRDPSLKQKLLSEIVGLESVHFTGGNDAS